MCIVYIVYYMCVHRIRSSGVAVRSFGAGKEFMKVLDKDGDGVITAKELEDLKVRLQKRYFHLFSTCFSSRRPKILSFPTSLGRVFDSESRPERWISANWMRMEMGRSAAKSWNGLWCLVYLVF